MEVRKAERYYTFDEWLVLDSDVKTELLDGEIVMMAEPAQAHHEVCGELFRQLANFLKGKPCKVYYEYAVRLSKQEHSGFVPDIIVVCDQSKLSDKKICDGAPDVIIEVLSPSSVSYDKFTKFQRYQKAGVREYWIVHPENKVIEVFTLENGRYFADVYVCGEAAAVPVAVLEGCEIDLGDVFEGVEE